MVIGGELLPSTAKKGKVKLAEVFSGVHGM
jgi:hypothetical protein